jgi:nitrile hydratase subunit alpha
MAISHHDHEHHRHDEPESDIAMRVKALESLLASKGLLDSQALDMLVDTYENRVGPRNGAKVVARAWSDPEFKQRLLKNATAAVNELGFPPGPEGINLIVLENTPKVHNMVVCTLCSCYPWSTLGLPPVWYKSPAYRARSVSDPRGVVREFGTELGDEVEIRVWDSSAEVRYLVLPERPTGTKGMSEEELAEIVTRDSMIGVSRLKPPKRAARRRRAGNGRVAHRAR